MKTSYGSSNSPKRGAGRKQCINKKRKWSVDPPIPLDVQTGEANSKSRAGEKVKCKEIVNPSDTTLSETRDFEGGRENPCTAEEYSRFAMRMNDHLSGAQLDQQSAENWAREAAVFLCGIIIIIIIFKALTTRTI